MIDYKLSVSSVSACATPNCAVGTQAGTETQFGQTDTLERQHSRLCRRIGYARAKSAVKPWFCSAVWLCGLGHQVAGSAAHFQFDLISIEFQVSSISLTRASQTGSASPSNSLDLVIEIKAESQRANHPLHPQRKLIDK